MPDITPLPPSTPSSGQGRSSRSRSPHPAEPAAVERRQFRQSLALAALILVVIVVAAVLASTLTDSEPESVRADRSPTTSSPPARPSTTSSRQTATTRAPSTRTVTRTRKDGPQITIAFAGDTNGEGLSPEEMAEGMAERLGPMKTLLSSADLTIANLETAVTARGTAAGKQFTFRAPPSILEGMQSAGVDVVSMANNHGLDYGPDGLADSIAAKHTAPIPVVGIGADDAEAFAPAHATAKGLRIAVIGATQVLDSSLIAAWTATPDHGGLASAKRVDRLVAEVRKASASSDIVVVFLHWGTERTTCPNPAQKELARTLADAGAQLIIGGHAHRVLSGGFLGTSFVGYGLGNFGFYAAGVDAAHTGVLTVTLQGGAVKGYEWHPGLIRDRTPYPLSGAAALQAVDEWNRLRSCTDLTPFPT